MLTLRHFTTPLWMTERGAWENAAIIPLFERFTEEIVRSLGEYCNLWITPTEPMIYAALGGVPRDEEQLKSTFPPGKHDLQLTFPVLENLFLGHGAASRALHRELPGVQVGVAHNMPYIAATRITIHRTDDDEQRGGVRQSIRERSEKEDCTPEKMSRASLGRNCYDDFT